jgi:hypothetical protein
MVKRARLGKLRAPSDGGYILSRKPRNIITARTFGVLLQKFIARLGTMEL